MRVGDAFPSKWLKASDLQGRAHKVVIGDVVMEDVGDGEKPLLYFKGKKKGLVLNKTNAEVIASYFGDEMDMWSDREIEIYPDKTHYQGKLVDCIRVRVSAPPAMADDGDPEGAFE